MSREAHIPLVLWISAALLFHVVGGESAVEVAQTMRDRDQIRALARLARDEMRPHDETFELLLDDSVPTPPEVALPTPDKDAPPSEEEADEADDGAEEAKVEPPKPEPKKPEPKKPEPEKKAEVEPPKPEPPKPEPPKPEPVVEKPLAPEVATAAEPAPPPPPLPPADERIAIRQHVEKDQEDNAAAHRIADDANKVAEETMARIRSHDQDAPDPTPGGAHAGPKGEVGDSDHDDHAQSEDKAGDPDHAPGEAARKSTSAEHSTPEEKGRVAEKSAPAGASGQKTASGSVPRAPTLPGPPPAPGGAGPTSPEVHAAPDGTYTLDPANPGGDGKSRVAGKRRQPRPYMSPIDVASGAPGVARLSQAAVEAAVGQKQLRAERASDGASRRSAHRGSWETNKFEKWRAAIENYDPSVKVGNQTALNAARVPFATYINTIHNRLHPIFAEEFLDSLDDLSRANVLNDQDLVTHVEIVLSKDEGRIVRLGITKASGVTAFDVAALSSVSRASPYGRAPDAIVSPDGNVYLHWEFHRDPYDACTTRHASPFLLSSAPATPAKAPPPPRRGSRSDGGEAHGPLLPLRMP